MNRSDEESTRSSAEPRAETPSFGHLVLVWFLVGSSLWSLGSSLSEATTVAVPFSSMGAGLLSGTIVFVSLWVAGFRPSLSASVGYFVTESVLYLLLVVGVAPVIRSDFSPWTEVGFQTLSIVLAGGFVFTAFGRRSRKRIRHRGRRLLKLPTRDEPEGAGKR